MIIHSALHQPTIYRMVDCVHPNWTSIHVGTVPTPPVELLFHTPGVCHI